jgi:hypothetical protein
MRQPKWTGRTFNATGNEVVIQTLEIAHEWAQKGVLPRLCRCSTARL